MKAKRFLNVILTCLWVSAWPSLVPLANAAFDSGSTGADGAFNPTTNTALQIPESGVFNFTTVNIPSGVAVTFKRNTQNTPVTILASGNVTISGTISVNGGNANGRLPGEGAPGGFSGGVAGGAKASGTGGEGPGGGRGGAGRNDSSEWAGGGGGGGYSSGGSGGGTSGAGSGGAGGGTYGNDRILPLIGGSGGGAGGSTTGRVGGGGGGGAGGIIIASSGTITITGSVTANGGSGSTSDNYCSGGGGGSGGSIRLIANTVTGSGSLNATGGGGGGTWGYTNGGGGGNGRIRIEAWSNKFAGSFNPIYSSGYAYAVVPDNVPGLTITSIGGIDVPAVPSGAFSTPDVMLPSNTKNPVTIVVSGVNIPAGTTVTVKSTPAYGTMNTATSTLSGTDTSSTTSVQINVSTAYPSLITASVTFQLTASNGGPIYAEGEKVEWVRVAANLGGESSITYITASGREISVKM